MWPADLTLNTENLVMLVFFGAFLVQFLIYLVFFLRLAVHKPRLGTCDEPVSVIIPARNEAKNLMNNLPYIMQQDYPAGYQVVVVNDASWDSTKEVLETMQKQYAALHVIHMEESDHYAGSKKFAVTLGIKGAKYDKLIFTDADCIPSSKRWLRGMASAFQDKDVVIGYGPLARKKGMLNYFIRYDTFQIALQYVSFAMAGIPYMGVGRNLAYKKELFFSVKGFKKHYHIQSGDDDLFINQVARKRNTAVQVHPDAQTISQPCTTWKAWFSQKRRHLTTAGHYRFGHKVLLSQLPFFTLVFFVCLVPLLIWQSWLYVVLGILGFRWLVQILIFNGVMNKLGGKDLLICLPLLEVSFLILNPLIYISNTLFKPKKWLKR